MSAFPILPLPMSPEPISGRRRISRTHQVRLFLPHRYWKCRRRQRPFRQVRPRSWAKRRSGALSCCTRAKSSPWPLGCRIVRPEGIGLRDGLGKAPRFAVRPTRLQRGMVQSGAAVLIDDAALLSQRDTHSAYWAPCWWIPRWRDSCSDGCHLSLRMRGSALPRRRSR